MATTKAPENGVIRHTSGAARRIHKGDVIPDGWTFGSGGDEPRTQELPATKKATPKPSETTEAQGPSKTA